MAKNQAHRNYAATLRPLLPPEAFRRKPRRLLFVVGHLLVVAACCVVARITPHRWVLSIAGIVMGHSFACLAFFAHELSHNAIMRRGVLRQALETLLWGLNFIPATLWDEVHNHTHHLQTNTLNDPDRRFTTEQKTICTGVYTRLLYPHTRTAKWNPLVFVQFLGYITRNILSALSGGAWGMLPAHPVYSAGQRVRIAIELVLIAALQFIFLWAVGFRVLAYLFVGPVPLMVASSVVMAYVFTNHFLNPLHDENDPVTSSTSVVVPAILDWLHCHFSYHTEHHVFPAMDSAYYPLVSQRLQEFYPAEYKRIPIGEAWRRLWASEPFAKTRDPEPDNAKP